MKFNTKISIGRIEKIQQLTYKEALSTRQIAHEIGLAISNTNEYVRHLKESKSLIVERQEGLTSYYKFTGIYYPPISIEEKENDDVVLERLILSKAKKDAESIKPFRDWMTSAFFGDIGVKQK